MERSKLIKSLFFSCIALFLLACAPSNAQQSGEFLILAKQEYQSRLSQESEPQLIDVRTPAEFQAGAIAGAVNLNLLDGTFESSIEQLDPTKTVFVYCAKGGRSGKAATLLKSKGFKSVVDLKDGYSNW